MADADRSKVRGCTWTSTKYVVGAIGTAIIGDVAVRNDQSAIAWLAHQVTQGTRVYWGVLLTLLVLITFLVLLLWAALTTARDDQWDLSEYAGQNSFLLDLYRIQSSLMLNLDGLLFADDYREAERRLIKELLRDTFQLLGNDVMRGYVLMRSGNFLTTYVEESMPPAEGYERRFYVGDRRDFAPSVAGTSYRRTSTEVVHVDFENGRYVHDHPDFQVLMAETRDPGYRSFICVPIMLRSEPLGVLCIDSGSRQAFDVRFVQELVADLGFAIGVAHSVAEGLEQIRTKTVLEMLKKGDQT